MPTLGASDAARFWAKVRRSGPDACWPWVGSQMSRGYGQFMLNGRPEGAHRVAWALLHGPIPDGKHVLHHCDVRRCCNAETHLFLGTHLDNMQDAARKGRLHVQRPKRHKVTDEQVEEMIALRRSGFLLADIATRFAVTDGFVSLLLSGKRRQYRQPSEQRRSA
jgi:hypothetical protein